MSATRHLAPFLVEARRGYPVVIVTGPRQSGKTTMARSAAGDLPYVNLEDLGERDLALHDPSSFLRRFPEGAVIDEVQRCPVLFSAVQARVDADGRLGRFVLTGSQQFELMAQATQSLAGRAAFLRLLPFSFGELADANWAPKSLDEMMVTGGYPPIYDRKLPPRAWLADYTISYLERDARQLLNVRDLSSFQRFVRRCAAQVGQLTNFSSLAADVGITTHTAQAWLSVLEASYLVFRLQPHHANFGKRLVKAAKLYWFDTGLCANLLSIPDAATLAAHPLRGALFENWVVSELVKGRWNRRLESDLYFWRNHTGLEVDVLADQGTRLLPVEIKSGSTIAADWFITLSAWAALAGKQAGKPHLVYGGPHRQERQGVTVIPWRGIQELAAQL